MNLLFLTILFPLLGFIILAFSQGKWSKDIVTIIGISSVGISTCVTIYVAIDFYYSSICYNNRDFVFYQKLWTWFSIDLLSVNVSLRLDRLSLIFLSVINGIGFIIHTYIIWYMCNREGYSRFFSYTNLFMSNMILLVLSDNLLLMYVGWEGVGLCSYLLVGFYYFNFKNGLMSLQAFVMTRFSDICLVCALFMIYHQYHTFNFVELLKIESSHVTSNYVFLEKIDWISLMLFIGAVGKSAQLPLHTWLINAMVGPTPVSALIHAATMVTSGVYLIIRMNNFFLMAPNILYLVSIIGSLTILLFSFAALFQNDLKKILAYSTISQIGYMFLALGNRNWDAAVCHLITHAFFKALLFLSAGLLIYLCRHEQNIFNMGGLYKSIPMVYICFLIGGLSLSAFPIITAGFYSKGMILSNILESGNYFLFFSGLIGAFLTSIYTFRMIFVIFHGHQKIEPCICNYRISQIFPLGILLLLSTCIGGWIALLSTSNIMMDNNNWNGNNGIFCEIIFGVLTILGIIIALFFWLVPSNQIKSMYVKRFLVFSKIRKYLILLCYYGWGFEQIYSAIFIAPSMFIINKLRQFDPIDKIISIMLRLLFWLHQILMFSINGKLNWYLVSINIGAVILLVVMLVCCVHY